MLTDIAGVRVGHVTDSAHGTGCTAILFDPGHPVVGGVDVRGAMPATKDTDSLRPLSALTEVHGIALTGGSCFGLEAAFGIMAYLEAHNIGVDQDVTHIPVVPAAAIFDLMVSGHEVRPDRRMGWLACENAASGPFARGCVGAGTGARVGKYNGIGRASKGGVGTASMTVRGVTVAALMVVNAVGDVIDRTTGQVVAGARDDEGGFIDSETLYREKDSPFLPSPGGNTTIGVVCCDCHLTKEEANRIAGVAHDGIVRCIYPSHTDRDGDTIFATGHLVPGKVKVPVDILGLAAAAVVEQAILDAVRSGAADTV